MGRQTKPFIIERKPSRKPGSSGTGKTALWGALGLRLKQELQTECEVAEDTVIDGNEEFPV